MSTLFSTAQNENKCLEQKVKGLKLQFNELQRADRKKQATIAHLRNENQGLRNSISVLEWYQSRLKGPLRNQTNEQDSDAKSDVSPTLPLSGQGTGMLVSTKKHLRRPLPKRRNVRSTRQLPRKAKHISPRVRKKKMKEHQPVASHQSDEPSYWSSSGSFLWIRASRLGKSQG